MSHITVNTGADDKTRGGFEAGAFYSEAKWTAFVKLEKYDSKSIVFMKPEDLDAIHDLTPSSQRQIEVKRLI